MKIEWDYHLVVLGNPRGQGRPRATSKGKFASVYEDKKDKMAKQDIAVIVQQQAPEQLLDCPLRVDLKFYFPRPKGHYGSGRNSGVLKPQFTNALYTSKPDVDNLCKLVLDALTGIFWRDDACVVESYIKKMYSDKPRTEIFINRLS